MNETHTLETIRTHMILLRNQQRHEYDLLYASLLDLSESIKPINLIKGTLKNAIGSNEIRGGIVGSVVSLTAGYFFRKLVVGSSQNPMKKLLGTVLMFGASKILSKTGIISNLENGMWNLTHPSPEETDMTDEVLELTPEKVS